MLRPSMRGGVPVFNRPTRKRQLAQARRERIRGRVAGPAARVAFEAHMDPAAQERADRQHHGAAPETRCRSAVTHARHALALRR